MIGTPTDEELGFIRNEDARKYMRHLPQFPRRPFATMFPRVQPVALDLIERMLTFNPLQRITGQSPTDRRRGFSFSFSFLFLSFLRVQLVRLLKLEYYYYTCGFLFLRVLTNGRITTILTCEGHSLQCGGVHRQGNTGIYYFKRGVE